MIHQAEQTIESSIRENDAHVLRLQRAQSLLAQFFPLTEEEFVHLDEDQIEHVDQFIYRFSKLQDSMGTRLLPSVYAWLERDTKPRPFLDILNRLEKLDVLSDVEKWQFFRNLRNNLAHDYPESIHQTVETLNILFAEINNLIALYTQVRSLWVQRKGE